MVGIGGKVDVGFVVAVEDAVFFVVEVENGLLVFIFEECFVRPDNFGIVAEARPDAGAKPEQTFDSFGGQKGIAEDVVRLLADAVYAAGCDCGQN